MLSTSPRYVGQDVLRRHDGDLERLDPIRTIRGIVIPHVHGRLSSVADVVVVRQDTLLALILGSITRLQLHAT